MFVGVDMYVVVSRRGLIFRFIRNEDCIVFFLLIMRKCNLSVVICKWNVFLFER